MSRLRRFGALWAGLLVGASALAAQSRFDAAVDDTSLGLDPGQAFFMVDVLAAQGRTEDAQSLRRALWERQLARMRGKAFVDEPRVGEAIAQGRALPATDAGFEDAWREAYNASARLAYRPAKELGELPPEFAPLKGWRPLGGGLWTQPQAGGEVRYLLSLTLEASKVALPLRPLQLRFGSAESGLTLQCAAAAAEAEDAFAQPGHAVELACDGRGEARWQELLPTLLGAARSGGDAPTLLPGAGVEAGGADSPDAERRLWRRWHASFDEQLERWKQAAAMARTPANASERWLASPKRLAPPVPLAASPAARSKPASAGTADIWVALQLRLVVSALALGFFAVGRLALRHAQPAARNVATVVLGILVAVLLLVSPWGPGKLDGDGWANLGVVASGLALAIGVSMAVIVALLLHRLHDLLDAEGRTWPGVVANGWRQALWMFGQASRGEFWGFVLFAAWAWALAVPLGKPWAGIIGLALLVPLVSLTWRRALSLTRGEIAVGLATIATFIIDLILRHHI